MRYLKILALCLPAGVLLAAATPVFAQAGSAIAVPPAPTVAPTVAPETATPDFADLEARGVRIRAIVIVNQDIFDLSDPAEDNMLFRFANRFHVQTRPSVIERNLPFKPGEPVQRRVMEEAERLLRSNRYFYDVQLRPANYRDGLADIEVVTRDTWSLNVGASVGRAGGTSSGSVGLTDYNLMGTGATAGISRSTNADRSSTELVLQYNRAFDGWTSVGMAYANNSDGTRKAASVVRPFYELDARWAAGASVVDDDRIETLYRYGEDVAKFRHLQRNSEVFYGWSGGLDEGWVRRTSIGLTAQDDAYSGVPGEVTPILSPAQKIVAPFARIEWVEENYEKKLNRNLMGRPEFFALGLAANLQLGRALTGFGSSEDRWTYAASVSKGFQLWPGHETFLAASLSGRYGSGAAERQLASASARYYWALSNRWLLYGSATLEGVQRPALADLLTLGGENGLRGYPLRYQSGGRRAIFTAEARAFSDVYLWRLFRVGAAAFFDLGSAWRGPYSESGTPDWRRNVGVGLRVVSVRSAFGNVIHLDLAKPLDHDQGVKSLQFLIKTKTSF